MFYSISISPNQNYLLRTHSNDSFYGEKMKIEEIHDCCTGCGACMSECLKSALSSRLMTRVFIFRVLTRINVSNADVVNGYAIF